MSTMNNPIPTIPNCPTCKEAMSEGFTLDQTYGSTNQTSWVEGKPVNSFWTGIKLKGRLIYPVTTFRCRTCGLLQSYCFRPAERHG